MATGVRTHRSNPKQVARSRRHLRVRKKVHGGAGRPRLAVFRSSRHVVAQLIDDRSGRTLAAASSMEASVRGQGDKTAQARAVGAMVADRAKDAGIEHVVFDRGGYRYHGRVAALAEGAREHGLNF
jgi:large subunit ribosomal protein L18